MILILGTSIIKELWHVGVLAVWRQVPDGLGPDFPNFLMVVVAEDEAG